MTAQRTSWLALVSIALFPFGGCNRSDEAPRAPAVTSQPNGARAPAKQRASHRPRHTPDAARPIAIASASASPEAAPAPVASVAPPELFAADGAALPQTNDEPKSTSAFFEQQAALLFRAIALDKPELARPFFFPRVAYRKVKAIANPDRDYEERLLARFDRDIHAYHQKLGALPGRTRFVELYVPEDGARWMKPGSEGNKLGYYRVLRSQLRYEDADGKEQRLEITSLISWRGEWYVVHVHGFE